MNTPFVDVYESFESSFQDKHIIPNDLKKVWLLKAIGRYSIEIEELDYNEHLEEFNCTLPRSIVDLLAAYMKQYYQEREVSKVNKRVSLVTNQLSIDGNNGSKTAARNELEYDFSKSALMTEHMKTTAYV